MTLEITAIEPRITLDRRYAEPVVLPAAITEISARPQASVPAAVDTGCRDDLARDRRRQPCRSRVRATVAAAARRRPRRRHRLRGRDRTRPRRRDPPADDAPRARVCTSTASCSPRRTGRSPVTADPTATVTARAGSTREVTVDGCADGCWLVLGEGFHESWSASVDGRRPRPAAARRRRLQRLVDRPERRAGRGVDRVDGAAPLTIALVLTVLAVLACVALAAARPASSGRAAGAVPSTLRPRRAAAADARAVDRGRRVGRRRGCCSSGRVGGSSPRWPPACLVVLAWTAPAGRARDHGHRRPSSVS